MPLQEPQVGHAGGAVGVDGARAGAALVRQVLEESRQRFCGRWRCGGGHASAHRSAVRSTTRARKSISSWPMSGEKASGLVGAEGEHAGARRLADRQPHQRHAADALGRRRRRGRARSGRRPAAPPCRRPASGRPGPRPARASRAARARAPPARSPPPTSPKSSRARSSICSARSAWQRAPSRSSTASWVRACASKLARAIASSRWRTVLSCRWARATRDSAAGPNSTTLSASSPQAQRLHQLRIVPQEARPAAQEGADRLVPRLFMRVRTQNLGHVVAPALNCGRSVPGRPSGEHIKTLTC